MHVVAARVIYRIGHFDLVGTEYLDTKRDPSASHGIRCVFTQSKNFLKIYDKKKKKTEKEIRNRLRFGAATEEFQEYAGPRGPAKI